MQRKREGQQVRLGRQLTRLYALLPHALNITRDPSAPSTSFPASTRLSNRSCSTEGHSGGIAIAIAY